MKENIFKTAQPVWLEGSERDVNSLVGFHATFEPRGIRGISVNIAASTIYRVFLNGSFIGHGPARAAHGFFRVDEWDVTLKLRVGVNNLAIEVVGYNIPSFAYLNQSSFLQAEVVDSNGIVLVATEEKENAFDAAIMAHRQQECERYSNQRTFCEIYQLSPDYDNWRTNGFADPAKLAVFDSKKLIARGVSYPKFDVIPPSKIVQEGNIEKHTLTSPPEPERPLLNEMISLKTSPTDASPSDWKRSKSITLTKNTFKTLDFTRNLCGFIGFSVKCSASTRVLLVFDEIMIDDDVSFLRQSALNTVACNLVSGGTFKFETIEPYVMRYLKIIVLDGDCEFDDAYLREFANPDADAVALNSDDEDLNLIFDAARQSLRQNAVDLFMDCPGRERAGWIGDTYYTAKAAPTMMGNISVETNQMENYALPEKFPDIPYGPFPMCYPAEHPTGRFISTFCFWFVMQLKEYAERGGDPSLIDALKVKTIKMFDYFKGFENELGLLEKLDSWIFIEWSKAASFTQDVSIPANLLYLQALRAADELYGESSFSEKADHLVESIRVAAFNGRFFADNLIREDGVLRQTTNHTEICQYFAFAAKVATPKTDSALWKTLLDLDKNPQSDLHPRNVLFGECVRMELLAEYGYIDLLIEEIRTRFLPMALRTGTLWEMFDEKTSCNHGFTAYVGYLLLKYAAEPYENDVSV